MALSVIGLLRRCCAIQNCAPWPLHSVWCHSGHINKLVRHGLQVSSLTSPNLCWKIGSGLEIRFSFRLLKRSRDFPRDIELDEFNKGSLQRSEGQEGRARLPATRWKQGPLQTLKGSSRDYQSHENFEEEAAGGQRKPEGFRGM